MNQKANDLFVELIKIPSESRNERAVADCLKEKLTAMGFEVTEDNAGEAVGANAGNIIARRKGEVQGKKPLFFSAHMDTVKPGIGIEPVMEGTVMKSAGDTILGADNKAGITAAMIGVQQLLEAGTPICDVEFWFSICEEVGLYGARGLDLNTVSARNGYVLDGGGAIGGYVKQGAGRANIEVEVKGLAAHAGAAPEKGLNAIAVAADMISQIPQGRIDSETTINFGVIEGGKETNVVPDYVKILGESRSLNEGKLQAQLNLVKEVAEATAKKWNTEIKVHTELSTDPLFLPDDSESLQILLEAYKAMGVEPEAKLIGGGSDANVYCRKGVDAIVLSVGPTGSHSVNEILDMNDLAQACDMVSNIILANSK